MHPLGHHQLWKMLKMIRVDLNPNAKNGAEYVLNYTSPWMAPCVWANGPNLTRSSNSISNISIWAKYSHPKGPACSAMLLALEPQVFFIVKNMERCFRVSETKWGIPLYMSYMLYQEVQMDWTLATWTWPVHKYLTRFFTGFSTSQIVQDMSYQQYLEQKSVGSLGRKCRPLLQDTKFMAYEIITKKMKYFFRPMCWNDHCWIIICSEFLQFMFRPRSKVGKFNNSPGSTDLI